MEIKKLLAATEEFERYMTKIEEGREQLTQLRDFLDSELDETSKTYFKTMVGAALPSLVEAFTALETALSSPAQPPVEPTPES